MGDPCLLFGTKCKAMTGNTYIIVTAVKRNGVKRNPLGLYARKVPAEQQRRSEPSAEQTQW